MQMPVIPAEDLLGDAQSDQDQRFLAILGPGFSQTAPRVSVNPFPDMLLNTDSRSRSPISVDQSRVEALVSPTLAGAAPPPLPRQTRQKRYRSRPLAPLDEARRVLSQVEMQRAAADAVSARALHLIGQNLGRFAEAIENYMAYQMNNYPQ